MILTVRPPWSWAMMWGRKDVENRTGGWRMWRRCVGDELWIHSATTWSRRGAADPKVVEAYLARGGADRWTTRLTEPPKVPGTRYHVVCDEGPPETRLHLGYVIGQVHVVNAHDAHPRCCSSPWAESSYADAAGKVRHDLVHLVLSAPRALANPVPARGRLGLWHPDPDLTDELADAELLPV